MAHGVRIFRVDNPHTKPVMFWEWLLGEVRKTDPDVLFLSEAFTKPPMMQTLATVGFHQSYTYFTWRNAKWELETYLTELSPRDRARDAAELLREHPRHPARVPPVRRPAGVQDPGRARGDRRRRRWGVYAGYELFEHVAVKPGSEEYLDSEKYQIRIRDWEAADAEGRTLAPYLTRLNEIRRAHPALQQLRNLTVHSSEDDSILVFSKTASTPDGGRATPSSSSSTSTRTRTRETTVHLDMPALGLDWHDHFARRTTRSPAQTWTWGEHNYVRLDPYVEPAHILTVRRHHRLMTAACRDRQPPTAAARTAGRPARLVQDARSSTRCWCAPSRTPTATASATSRA